MKSLNTLIKLAQRRLDELRRRLADLEVQRDKLLALIKRLDDELASELEQAYQRPEMSTFFGDFSRRIRKRKEEITREIAALATQMEKVREDIMEGFSELKKYEVARDHAKARERQEQERKETKLLDEIAQQQFIRKTE